MRNHELFGALLSIPFRRGKRQMAWIDRGHHTKRSKKYASVRDRLRVVCRQTAWYSQTGPRQSGNVVSPVCAS
jgi:hypothetical protein